MELYEHQKKFLKDNPDKAIVSYGAGTGKTLVALEWLKLRPGIPSLVVCPKAIKSRWIIDTSFSSDIDVLTKEEFKKVDLNKYRAMVFDECHAANSPLFNKQRSQITTAVYNWIKGDKGRNFLGLTATPISSQPWNIHTLLTFSGKYIDKDQFLKHFYKLEKRGFMKGRMAYFPVKTWRPMARKLVEKYCYTATMADVVGHIPEQYEEVIHIKPTKGEQEAIDFQPENPDHDSDVAVWYSQHRLEQVKGKIDKIKEIASDHSKVVIFAKYKEQISVIRAALKSERQVYVMTGDTKDQGAVIKEAQDDSECYFIVQADISEGYELPDFTCVIYASQSWRKISDIQSRARVQRINNLKSNWYYWLIAGDKDRAVFKAIEKGEDFIVK